MLLLGKIGLAFAGTAVAGMGILFSEGTVVVNVTERQPESHHVYVIAPAMLIPIAAHFAPKDRIAEASKEMRPYLPAIRAAIDQLRECDDLTLVEVKEPGNHVLTKMTGGSVIVDVDDEGETVHISTPLRAISSAIAEIAAATPSHES
jgi:hypothetical protein